jgi:hypothetical protein
VVRVVPWLLEREYRQHRLLDSKLPATFAAWRAAAGAPLEREGCELSARTVKMVVHPAEVEAWARRVRCEIDDAARSDLARLLWQAEANSLQAARARAHRQRSISSCRFAAVRAPRTYCGILQIGAFAAGVLLGACDAPQPNRAADESVPLDQGRVDMSCGGPRAGQIAIG